MLPRRTRAVRKSVPGPLSASQCHADGRAVSAPTQPPERTNGPAAMVRARCCANSVYRCRWRIGCIGLPTVGRGRTFSPPAFLRAASRARCSRRARFSRMLRRVGAQTSGQLKRLHVQLGDKVTKDSYWRNRPAAQRFEGAEAMRRWPTFRHSGKARKRSSSSPGCRNRAATTCCGQGAQATSDSESPSPIQVGALRAPGARGAK